MEFHEIVLRIEEIRRMAAGPEQAAAQDEVERDMARGGFSTPDVNTCLKLRGMDPQIAEGKVILWGDCLKWGREAPAP